MWMSYGTASDLATLVTNAHSAGLRLIVDVAIHQFAQPVLIILHIILITLGKLIHLHQEICRQLQQFWWPQTKVSGYIPFGNTATSCASFANNTNGIIALWANNPNGSTYNASFSSTTPWDADFSRF